ncbi:4-hydroxythreonine-4-phosphate dehydrogenase PdxA [Polaromonas sp. P1(28)-8]|nr:4-hydroxythreonine-4-phosphate dehydrogenase PdxA [Polaromonas sp. P1(28)-8]
MSKHLVGVAGANSDRLPDIVALIGDPGGIGPEVCVKAIASGRLHAVCNPFLLGSVDVVRQVATSIGVPHRVELVTDAHSAVSDPSVINVIDPGGYDFSQFAIGVPTANAGRAVVRWIREGEALGRSGLIDGFVLGPIDSQSLKLDGEILDIDELQPKGTFMFRIGGNLRVVPLTEHIPLRAVVDTVKKDRILELILLLNSNLKRWGIPHPRLGVAGLNPHAMFEEDKQEVLPAVEAARALGLDVSGPIAPDAVFRMALEGKYDAVVTMYHDQGQIAVKTAAFVGACTIYMGLPFVLMNVPHGTAFDIAGKGVARSESIESAYMTAAALAQGKGFLEIS